MTEEIIRPDIYELIKEAVKDGLAIVRQFEASGKIIYRYFDFPKMNQLPSGFPSFRESFMGDDAPNVILRRLPPSFAVRLPLIATCHSPMTRQLPPTLVSDPSSPF